MTRGTRTVLIILLTVFALSILNAGRGWELEHRQSAPTQGAGYELAALAMLGITIFAMRRIWRG